MSEQITLAIPLLVILIMTIVGTDLRFTDFLRMRRYPVLVPTIVFGQWMLLVLVAGLVGWVLTLPPTIAGGAILFAAAPVAALSGYYAKLAGGDLALAVTIAAFSNLLATLITPIAASFGFWWFLGNEQAMALPLLKVAQQTLIGLLLPLLAGMLLRHHAANWVERWRGPVQGVGLFSILVLLALVLADQFAVIRAQFRQLIGASLLLTLAMLTAGFLAVRLLSLSSKEGAALVWSFPARNLAIATLTATSVMGQMTAAAFLAVLFTTQISLLPPLALWLNCRNRRKHRARPQANGQEATRIET